MQLLTIGPSTLFFISFCKKGSIPRSPTGTVRYTKSAVSGARKTGYCLRTSSSPCPADTDLTRLMVNERRVNLLFLLAGFPFSWWREKSLGTDWPGGCICPAINVHSFYNSLIPGNFSSQILYSTEPLQSSSIFLLTLLLSPSQPFSQLSQYRKV